MRNASAGKDSFSAHDIVNQVIVAGRIAVSMSRFTALTAVGYGIQAGKASIEDRTLEHKLRILLSSHALYAVREPMD